MLINFKEIERPWVNEDKLFPKFPIAEFLGERRSKRPAIKRPFRECFNCFSPYLLRVRVDERNIVVFCCECGSMIKVKKIMKSAKNPKKFMIRATKYYSNGMFVHYGLDGYLAVPNIMPLEDISCIMDNLYKESELDKDLSYVTQRKKMLGFHRDNNHFFAGNRLSIRYFQNYLGTLSLEEQIEWIKWFDYWYGLSPTDSSKTEYLKLDYKKNKNKQRIKAFAAKKES